MNLFDEIPELKSERLILRPFVPEDAFYLKAMTEETEVYRFEPSFLYEQKYEDKEQVIARKSRKLRLATGCARRCR